MRVLFFRPEEMTQSFKDYLGLLSNQKLEIINIPLFKIKCIKYTLPNNIDEYEAIAFTSQNSVLCFTHINEIKNHKIYAIGDETSELLRNVFNINPIIPKQFTSIELAKKLLEDRVTSVIAIRSKRASDDMKKLLENRIRYIEIYDYDIEIIEENIEKARNLIENCKIDGIAITSSLIAKIVGKYINNSCNIKIFSIGPLTTRALMETVNGVKIIESKTHSIKGILETIIMEMKSNG